MALFNIFLQNDDPKLRKQTHLPTGWANEFVHRSSDPSDLDDLKKRTDPQEFKTTFLGDERIAEHFRTSAVLSRKVLEVFMKSPDFQGIKVCVGIHKESTPETPRSSFFFVPVDSKLESITGSPRKRSDEAEDGSSSESDTYYSEDSTMCPPRLGCNENFI